MNHIFIIGAPKTGKTTLAKQMGQELRLPIVHSDDYIELGWKDAKEALLKRVLRTVEPTIFEGVTVARLLPRELQDGLCAIPKELVWCRGPSEKDPRWKGMTSWITKYAKYNKSLGLFPVREYRYG